MTAPVFPAAAPIIVQIKGCCEVLAGEVCDCAAFAAAWLDALADPIMLPPHGPLRPLTDPALDVWRPDQAWVEDMRPPLRWSVTADGVEVGL